MTRDITKMIIFIFLIHVLETLKLNSSVYREDVAYITKQSIIALTENITLIMLIKMQIIYKLIHQSMYWTYYTVQPTSTVVPFSVRSSNQF